MQSERLIAVTRELIKRGENGSGGWNRAQLKILGIEWPPEKGWIDRVVGRPISKSDAVRFVALKGQKGTSEPTKRLFD